MTSHTLRFFSHALLVGTCLCVAGKIAHAQPARGGAPVLPAESDDEKLKKAVQRYEEGKRAWSRHDLLEAYRAYRDAFRLKPSYDHAANLADAEVELAKSNEPHDDVPPPGTLRRDAAQHYQYCLYHFPSSARSPREKREQAQREQHVREKWGKARAEVGALRITVNVNGAEVLVDGTPVGVAPFEGEVYAAPGDRALTAKLAEHMAEPVTLRVVKATGDAPPQEVQLALKAEPEKVIFRDPDPPPGPGPSPLSTPGPFSTPDPLSTPPPRPPEAPAGGADRRLLIAGGTLAGAALVSGVVLTAVSFAKAGDAVAQRDALVRAGGPTPCASQSPAAGCAALADTLRARATTAGAAFATLLGGSVVGIATGVYALAAPKGRERTATIQLTPAVSGREAVVIVQGTW